MLYYDRIDLCEVIDVSKTSSLKECNICDYWYFLVKGLKFQAYVYDGCHDVLMISMSFSHFAILNIYSVICCCIIKKIRKSEAKKLTQNIYLSGKTEHYKT